MKHITITVPDNKHAFTVELCKNLRFVKEVVTTEPTSERVPTKKEFIKNLKQAFKEVKLIEQGKKKGTSMEEFLKEQ